MTFPQRLPRHKASWTAIQNITGLPNPVSDKVQVQYRYIYNTRNEWIERTVHRAAQSSNKVYFTASDTIN